MTEPGWWNEGSPDYDGVRVEKLVGRIQWLIHRDMPGKDFDALVVGAHFEDATVVMRYGPDGDDAEENDGVED